MDLVDGTSDGIVYWRSVAPAPDLLGVNSQPWLRGESVSTGYNAPINLSDLEPLSDCSSFTEPALYVHEGEVYLATNCMVTGIGGGRINESERLVLLRQEADGYSFVGTITDALDAADLGGDRLEQADIALSRDGTVLLIVTPLINGAAAVQQGCVVLEFANFATAELLRDEQNVAIPRAIVTVSEANARPGACTYDAASDTGLLLVSVVINETTNETVYSILRTGYHP